MEMNLIMKYHIYADHAATTQIVPEVLEAMQPYLHDEYGNPSSIYGLSIKSRYALKQARMVIADSLGCQPEEIYFTSGGSESDNWALKGVAFQNPNTKVHIIASEIEHHAILRTCDFLSNFGHQISYLSVDPDGVVLKSDLKKIITKHSLVSVMLANNEIGTIEPIQELANIAHQNDSIFHTDAVQAIGHIPVNVNKLGVDLLSASAHKFNGPRGVGFLYARSGLEICPLIHGGGQEFGCRAGTENVAGIVGMAKALELNCQQMEQTTKYLLELRCLFKSMMNISGIDYCLNEADHNLPGTISLSIKNMDGERLLHRLDLMGIAISTGSACNSKESKLSHVIEALHLSKSYAYGTIRITLGKDNTVEDIKTIVNSITKICNC